MHPNIIINGKNVTNEAKSNVLLLINANENNRCAIAKTSIPQKKEIFNFLLSNNISPTAHNASENKIKQP